MLDASVNSDLLHTEPYAGHRLPVVRVKPTLYAPELKLSEWPEFLRGCIHYRQSLDEQLPHAPRSHEEHRERS